MDLKIGVIHSAREIEMEIEEDASSVAQMAEQALAAGARMIWFTDKKGRRVGVVAEKLSYLEFIGDDSPRTVGFSA